MQKHSQLITKSHSFHRQFKKSFYPEISERQDRGLSLLSPYPILIPLYCDSFSFPVDFPFTVIDNVIVSTVPSTQYVLSKCEQKTRSRFKIWGKNTDSSQNGIQIDKIGNTNIETFQHTKIKSIKVSNKYIFHLFNLISKGNYNG